jgi:hypothetical protein
MGDVAGVSVEKENRGRNCRRDHPGVPRFRLPGTGLGPGIPPALDRQPVLRLYPYGLARDSVEHRW